LASTESGWKRPSSSERTVAADDPEASALYAADLRADDLAVQDARRLEEPALELGQSGRPSSAQRRLVPELRRPGAPEEEPQHRVLLPAVERREAPRVALQQIGIAQHPA
jgi:hypothetical protein